MLKRSNWRAFQHDWASRPRQWSLHFSMPNASKHERTDNNDRSKSAEHQPKHKQTDTPKLLIRIIAGAFGLATVGAGVLLYAAKLCAALYLFGFCATLVAIDVELYWIYELNHSTEIGAIFVVWCAASAVFLATASTYDLLGPIRPETVATQPITKPIFSEGLALRSGTGHAMLHFGGMKGLSIGQNMGPPLKFGTQVPFRTYVENGRLFCDVVLYGDDPSAPAIEIKHNELDAVPRGWDVNTNGTISLEIVDDRYRPRFQMYYQTPTDIVINGLLLSGNMIWIMSHGLGYGINNPNLPRALQEFTLTRLFKYPSKVFPGVPN
jgi:hypothetical protein